MYSIITALIFLTIIGCFIFAYKKTNGTGDNGARLPLDNTDIPETNTSNHLSLCNSKYLEHKPSDVIEGGEISCQKIKI